MNKNITFSFPKYAPIISLTAIWLVGNIWTFTWFLDAVQANIFIFTALVLGLGIYLWRSPDFSRESFSFFPQPRLYPLMLIMGGEIAAICLKWLLYIPQLTFLCFILASYGLLGLFVCPTVWQKNLSLAVITACVLPFSIAFNSGLGFPVRVITANLVAESLTYLNLQTISSHDIILMENGIAQVDLPCSGIKSFWMGTVFLLGVTWLEKRKLGLHWSLIVLTNLILLLIANIIRVLLLVLLVEVGQQPQIANILHLPLGMIGFTVVGIITWTMLQGVPQIKNQNRREKANTSSTIKILANNNVSPSLSNFSWLLTIVLFWAIIGQFKPAPSMLMSLNTINLPAEITTEKLALSPAETNFFDQPANPLVQKVKFKSAHLSGSMLLVASDTWHAHHPPELCFVGNGFKVDAMHSTLIDDSIKARWLSLQNGQQSATYWFQSVNETTDNFISRIWEDLAHSQKTWVLVSVLFDDSRDVNSLEVQDFARNIYQSIDRNLKPTS